MTSPLPRSSARKTNDVIKIDFAGQEELQIRFKQDGLVFVPSPLGR